MRDYMLLDVAQRNRSRCWSSAPRSNRTANRRATSQQILFRLLLAVATALLPRASTLEAKTLQWRLVPDQRLRLIVERTTRQSSPATEWTETIQYQLLWVVTSRDDDNRMYVAQKLTEVKHTLQLPGAQPVIYDSSLEGEPQGDAAELARYWKPLLNVERPITLSAQGQLVRTETPPPNSSTAAAAAATSPATPAGTSTSANSASTPAGAAPTVTTGTTANADRTATQSAPPNPVPARTTAPRLLPDVNWTLPEDELSLGYSWAETQLAPWRDIADAIKVTTSYTYQGEEEVEQRQLDKIVVQARWDVQPTPAAPRPLSIERQASSGVIYFDEQAGYLARAEFSHDLGVRVSPAQADPVPAEISLLLKIRCHPVLPDPEVEVEPATVPPPETTDAAADK
jgi:hypothetical protein